MALCTDFYSSGKACRAGQEPASLSLHPHFLTLLLLWIEDSLMVDCGDMQYKLFSVRLGCVILQTEEGIWQGPAPARRPHSHLSYGSHFALRNIKHQKYHSTELKRIKNTPTPLVLLTVNSELIMRAELHVYLCYFNPLMAVEVAVMLLCSMDQPKHDLTAFI